MHTVTGSRSRQLAGPLMKSRQKNQPTRTILSEFPVLTCFLTLASTHAFQDKPTRPVGITQTATLQAAMSRDMQHGLVSSRLHQVLQSQPPPLPSISTALRCVRQG